MSYLKHLRA